MKRVLIASLSVVALACVTGVAFVGGAVPGVDGCVLRSVDKDRYVAENEALFSTIPIPPYLREANQTAYSVGIPAQDACLPFENGPPYDAYITWHVYTRKPGELHPLGYDRSLLRGAWVSQLSGGPDQTFRRGQASLYVHYSDEAVSFAVDHQAQ